MIYPFKVGTTLEPQSVIPKVGHVVWYVHTPECVTSCQSEAVIIKIYEGRTRPSVMEGTWLRVKFPKKDWGMNGEYDCYSNKCYPMKTQKGNIITGGIDT